MYVMPFTAQKSAQDHVCRKVAYFLACMSRIHAETLPWIGSFEACENCGKRGYEDIHCDPVDLMVKAVTCDPCDRICEELADCISNPLNIFPIGKCLIRQAVISGTKRQESMRLCVRALSCGKLRLRKRIKGSGGVFAAGKSGGRQRKIWDGSSL